MAGAQSKSQSFDIQADESTNALVITASLEVFRSLQAVIRQLDVRRAQVLVEGIIAEISLNKAAQLGVQWAVNGAPGGHGPVGFTNFVGGTSSSLATIAGAATSGTAGAASLLGQAPEGLLLGIGRFDSNSINFGALISALQGDASTNVLSTPTLLTLDNQEAEIVVGQNVPFLTGSYTSVSSTGSSTPTNPFQTIDRPNRPPFAQRPI